MTIRPVFAWYDLWVGAFWDQPRSSAPAPWSSVSESGIIAVVVDPSGSCGEGIVARGEKDWPRAK